MNIEVDQNVFVRILTRQDEMARGAATAALISKYHDEFVELAKKYRDKYFYIIAGEEGVHLNVGDYVTMRRG